VRSRNGIALLVALAAVIVVLTAMAGTMRQLAATQRGIVVATTQDRHQDLLLAGEQLASAWIVRHGDQLVLPPAGGGVRVADDLLAVGDDRARLQVWVYDGLAGVPYVAAMPAGEFRGALPGRWSAVSLPPLGNGGGAAVDAGERARIPEGARRFPAVQPTSVVSWSGIGQALPQPASSLGMQTPAEPSLVEVIAFASDGRVNLNSAPEWLLTAIFTTRERGDLAELLKRRERGLANEQEDPDGRPGVRLVSRSDRWHALIIVTWNDRRRTWWVDLSGNSAGVRILQRHDADQ
jgi:hypothetical protein